MNSLRVELAERSYDIVVTGNDLAGVGAFARDRCAGRNALVIADEKVLRHGGLVEQSLEKAGFEVSVAWRPPGEGQKSLHSAAQLYDRLIELPADRRTLIV